MWDVSELRITMTVGDYGIELPLTVTDVEFSANDKLELTIKKAMHGDALVAKTFENIEGNTVKLELSAEESAALPVGSYVYKLDWYQNGVFMCNIIKKADYKVVDKA